MIALSAEMCGIGVNYADQYGVVSATGSLPTWTYFSQESKTRKELWYHRVITERGKAALRGKKRPRQWIRGYMGIQRFRGIANFGQLPCDGVTYQWKITI
jgi:hypothetical protein